MVAEVVLDNIYSYIIDYEILKPSLRNELNNMLSYRVQGAHFSHKYREGKWDGRIYLINAAGRFPTGFAGMVLSFLKDKGCKVYVNNNVEYPEINSTWEWVGPELRDYQVEAADTCLRRHRGIVELPTRVGKTFVMAKVIQELGLKTLVIVPGKSAMDQFIEDVEGCVSGPTFGRIGAGFKEYDADIYVGIIETLRRLKGDNLKKLTEKCGLFIIDEVHRAGADGLFNFSLRMKSPFRFGFSGTAFRSDNRDLRLIAATGRIIYKKDQEEMWDADVIEKPTVVWVLVQAKKIHRAIHYRQHYAQGVINCEERNELVRELVEKHNEEKDQVMVSVENIEHGEILHKLCKPNGAVFVSGKEKEEFKGKVVEGLKDGSVRVVITTRIFNEALTFPDLAVFINAAGRKSPGELIQKYGRVQGKGDKEKVLIYDFWDAHSHYLLKHSKERFKQLAERGYEQTGYFA